MQQYLILLQGKGALDYSPEEFRKRMDGFQDWVEGLADRYISANRLKNQGAHFKNQTQVITDGPFLEPTEIIAGYIIFKAESLEAAMADVARLPLLAHFEAILRPMVETDSSQE